MLRVKDKQEQVKLTKNAKRGIKLNGIGGIEINNTICKIKKKTKNVVYHKTLE